MTLPTYLRSVPRLDAFRKAGAWTLSATRRSPHTTFTCGVRQVSFSRAVRFLPGRAGMKDRPPAPLV